VVARGGVERGFVQLRCDEERVCEFGVERDGRYAGNQRERRTGQRHERRVWSVEFIFFGVE
jgi:hypothetical protein